MTLIFRFSLVSIMAISGCVSCACYTSKCAANITEQNYVVKRNVNINQDANSLKSPVTDLPSVQRETRTVHQMLMVAEPDKEVLPSASETTLSAVSIDSTNNQKKIELLVSVPQINLKLDKPKKEANTGFSLSDIGSIGAVLISIISLVWTWLQTNRLKRQSIDEGFWMREILIPLFMDKFLIFVKDAPKHFEETMDATSFYIDYALEKLNELRESLVIADAIDTNLKAQLETAIENFENFMGEEDPTNSASFTVGLTTMASSVIQAIRQSQYKIA